MTNLIERFLCGLLGHRYVVERVVAPHWRKVGCTRCHQHWGMHDPTKAFVLWDDEQEELAAMIYPTRGAG